MNPVALGFTVDYWKNSYQILGSKPESNLTFEMRGEQATQHEIQMIAKAYGLISRFVRLCRENMNLGQFPVSSLGGQS